MARTVAAQQNSSQLIRERLLSGEAFAVPQLAEEFGVTKGLVSAVLMKFRQSGGYEVKAVSKPFQGRRMKHYSVSQRTERPKTKTAPASQDNGETPLDGGAPAPGLGQTLIVSLLALGPKGELRLGLRDSRNHTFVCTIDSVG